MKKNLLQSLVALVTFGLLSAGSMLRAEGLDPALQAKVDAQIQIIKTWAADPALVAAVKAQNGSLPAEYADMTEAKWSALTVMDPLVRKLDKSPAGQFLKGKKSEVFIRAFVSDAAGYKVGFTTKTLNWSHKGAAKHEQPMAGKIWQGNLEQDKASGLEQIQIAVPVLDGDKPIGSLVVGMSVAKLKE